MESLKRHWPYLAAALALTGLGYFFYTRYASRENVGCFPIAFGNSTPNDCVKRFQRWLNRNSLDEPISEDGLWGLETADAVHNAGLPGYAYGPITKHEYKELTA